MSTSGSIVEISKLFLKFVAFIKYHQTTLKHHYPHNSS